MTNRYEIVPRKVWKLKEGFSGLPQYVSIHGSLPTNPNAYEMVEKGYSIYDSKSNTYCNYFFGKIGIDTREEAENIILKLTVR